MGKSRRCDKEITKERRLATENKKLKQQIQQLRKQLGRLDLDRYESIRETLQQHFHKESESSQVLENIMKKTWACKEAGCTGYLEIILFNKIDQPHYYRSCCSCNNRTRSQRFNPETVKGIFKKSTI